MSFGPYVLLSHFYVHEYNMTEDILNWLEKFLDKIQEIWSVKKKKIIIFSLEIICNDNLLTCGSVLKV